MMMGFVRMKFSLGDDDTSVMGCCVVRKIDLCLLSTLECRESKIRPLFPTCCNFTHYYNNISCRFFLPSVLRHAWH